ncbi:DUF4296 domain-containing protein [Flavobacterium sp. WC2509]|uniref:DUF4296 domain-containing protein n=1 Tax=Flavobacterium sp. WC2509 TaxID=3461406 RepID=UPI0040443CFB
MKKVLSLFILVALFLSCNKDLVEKPDNLIEKNVMKEILYDVFLLDVIKYQNPDILYANGVNPNTYIFKKYKIDSIQFVKSNAYYASDYREYKKMYDEVNDRLKNEKKSIDLINKKAEKKALALKKAKAKKAKELKIKREKDSINKVKKEKELKLKKKDSIAKVNAEKKKAKTKKTNKVTK